MLITEYSENQLVEQYKMYCNNLMEQHEAALKRAKEQHAPDIVIKTITKNIVVCREDLKIFD